MKKALVTGGAGFLGSTVVKQLVSEGVAVKVLALPTEPMDNLKGIDVEIVKGNVLSPDDAKAAVAGCDTVFHLAAIYKDYMKSYGPMYEVAQRGTFHMLQAAHRANVSKVVYTASIVALGRPEKGKIGNEDTRYEAWDINFHYSRSKHLSMLLAEDFAKWGLDVSIVCPGAVFGPGDIAPTPSGQIILNVVGGKAGNVYTDGGTSYVDVRDAANAHVLAARKGKAGERYIATAHNLDTKELVETIGRVIGKEATMRKAPLPIVRLAVGLMGKAALRKGEEPMMTLPFLDFSSKAGFYDNGKSIRDLGATYRPIEETIRDAVEYFRGRGLLPR